MMVAYLMMMDVIQGKGLLNAYLEALACNVLIPIRRQKPPCTEGIRHRQVFSL